MSDYTKNNFKNFITATINERGLLREGFVSRPGSVGDVYEYWARNWNYVWESSILEHYQQHKSSYGTSAEDYMKDVAKYLAPDQMEKVKSALSEEMAIAPAAPEPTYVSSGSPGEPLSTMEIYTLLKASEDPSTTYKLPVERLKILNHSNLSQEEKEILGASGSLNESKRKLIDLINF